MALIDLIMPKMGESIMEATILKWYKNVGDHIKQDETLLDIATDKVDSEVPSSIEGTVNEILFNINDTVAVGSVIARIATTAVEPQPIYQPINTPPPIATPQQQFISEPIYTQPAQPAVQETYITTPEIEAMPYAPQNVATTKSGNNRFFSPLVLNIANSEGLSLSELERITGTGADSRVSKRDVLQYITDKKSGKLPAFIAPAAQIIYVPQPAPITVAEQKFIHTPQSVTSQQAYSEPEAMQAAFIAPSTTPILIQEPVATVEAPKTAKAVAIIEAQKTAEPVAIVEVPKTAEPITKVEAPKTAEPVATVEAPETTQPVAAVEASKITEPVAAVEAPKITELVAVVEAPALIEQVTIDTPAIEKPVVTQIQSRATSIPQTTVQSVQQSVFVPTPTYTKNIPLTTLAEGVSGKFANPISALPTGNTEIIEMDRMRKLIAKHMVNSVQTSPHVTSFVEADVTNMVLWRNRVKDDFEKRESTKITFTPMFIECLVKVMQQFPLINSSINGDTIVVKKDFNIGMATALPSGNLIVPVIKSAEKLNIVGLSMAVNNLANAARNSALKPDDTTGGTFTFTNVGTFGSLMGTPIINQPQVAILAVGVIKKRPVVIESESGDTIGIRHMMYLSLSYDHRVIDGSIGASFLTAVAKEFEHWDINRTWYQYT